jgi:hypothetical protein
VVEAVGVTVGLRQEDDRLAHWAGWYGAMLGSVHRKNP